MTPGQRDFVRVVLFVVSVVFVMIGWFREEVRIVFVKSINICLECIGIG